MIRKRISTLLVTAGALCAAQTAGATNLNGFLREAGQADMALSYTIESYDEFWMGTNKVSDPGLGTVSTQSVSLWFAYGLADQMTITGNLPWIHSEGDGLAGFSEEGVQDMSLLLMYRLARLGTSAHHSFVLAGGGRAPASSYEDNAPVDIGDGTTDFLARFIYQLQISSFYLSQQVGYDIRGGDAPNGVPLYTEAGWTFGGRTTVNGWYDKYIAEDGTDIGDPGFTFPSNQEEYDRVGGKVFFRINRQIGLTAGGFTTLNGRNTGKSSGFTFGGVWSF